MILTVGYYYDLHFKIFYIYSCPELHFQGNQEDELTLVAACRDVPRVEVDHILTCDCHYDAFDLTTFPYQNSE